MFRKSPPCTVHRNINYQIKELHVAMEIDISILANPNGEARFFGSTVVSNKRFPAVKLVPSPTPKNALITVRGT